MVNGESQMQNDVGTEKWEKSGGPAWVQQSG